MHAWKINILALGFVARQNLRQSFSLFWWPHFFKQLLLESFRMIAQHESSQDGLHDEAVELQKSLIGLTSAKSSSARRFNQEFRPFRITDTIFGDIFSWVWSEKVARKSNLKKVESYNCQVRNSCGRVWEGLYESPKGSLAVVNVVKLKELGNAK